MKKNYTYSDELYHYGVRGMRWRNRKTNTVSPDEPSGKTGRDIEVDYKVSDSQRKLDEYLKQLEAAGQTGEVVKSEKYSKDKGHTHRRRYTIHRRRNANDMRRAREKHFKEIYGNRSY